MHQLLAIMLITQCFLLRVDDVGARLDRALRWTTWASPSTSSSATRTPRRAAPAACVPCLLAGRPSAAAGPARSSPRSERHVAARLASQLCSSTGCTAAASPPQTPSAAAQRSPACPARQEEVPFAHPLAPFPVAKRPSLAPSFVDKQEARPDAGAVPVTCSPLCGWVVAGRTVPWCRAHSHGPVIDVTSVCPAATHGSAARVIVTRLNQMRSCCRGLRRVAACLPALGARAAHRSCSASRSRSVRARRSRRRTCQRGCQPSRTSTRAPALHSYLVFWDAWRPLLTQRLNVLHAPGKRSSVRQPQVGRSCCRLARKALLRSLCVLQAAVPRRSRAAAHPSGRAVCEPIEQPAPRLVSGTAAAGSAVTAPRRAQVRVDAAVCGARQGRAPAAARRRPGAPRGRAGAGAAAPALAAAGRGRGRPPCGRRRRRPGRPGRRWRGGRRRGGGRCAAAGAARRGSGRRRVGGGRRGRQAARRRAGPCRRRRGRRRQPLPGRAALGGPARAGVRGAALVPAGPLPCCAPVTGHRRGRGMRSCGRA